jgi:16S rRNA (guanine527-N7)-methyltransferase
LIESTGKKARFLRLAVQQLGLANVHIENKRVEELAFEHDQRAGHDLVTVRAVASLPVLAEYCVPLLRDEGYVIAMKGAISPEEFLQGERAAQKIGARLIEVITVPMHQKMRARDRRLVILQKVRPTPKRYPRRAGMPKQRPLCGG